MKSLYGVTAHSRLRRNMLGGVWLAFPQESFRLLYGANPDILPRQEARYKALADRFSARFPDRAGMRLFSAPGRAEIGGNHTDHQSGRVLAAAIDLDTVAAAAPNGTLLVRVDSEGFAPITVDLSDLSAREGEKGTTAAVIRGCAARLKALGRRVHGFDAAVTSSVLVGSGLSSSAAFEVLICAIFDGLFGQGDLEPALRAQTAQYAENVYFGKPSGLLDQMASSVGGLVAVDFETETPKVEPLAFDFAAHAYALAIVNTSGSHDDLTHAYAAIPEEMRQVAACFGKERLRQVNPAAFEAAIPELRGKVSDRAILRAMHFFDEDARVLRQVQALKAGDLKRFFELIVASGESSWKLLQNVWANPTEQPLSLALELSHRMLNGKGAWRVHGGGFAGTILAFVPLSMLDAYRARMDAVFGDGACCPLNIRPVGPYEMPMW